MSPRSLLLLIAVAGGAAYLYQRRPGGTLMAGGARPLAADAFGAGMARPDERDRSLDRSEVLEDESLLGSAVSPGPDPTGAGRGRDTEDLFGSSSQQGAEPMAAGLPDLTRGA